MSLNSAFVAVRGVAGQLAVRAASKLAGYTGRIETDSLNNQRLRASGKTLTRRAAKNILDYRSALATIFVVVSGEVLPQAVEKRVFQFRIEDFAIRFASLPRPQPMFELAGDVINQSLLNPGASIPRAS